MNEVMSYREVGGRELVLSQSLDTRIISLKYSKGIFHGQNSYHSIESDITKGQLFVTRLMCILNIKNETIVLFRGYDFGIHGSVANHCKLIHFSW